MTEEQGNSEQPRKATRLVLATQDGVALADQEEKRSGGGGPPSGGGAGGKQDEIPTFASEVAMANELVTRRLDGDWRYSTEKKWLHWDGRCWRDDDTDAIKWQAKEIVAQTSTAIIAGGGTAGVARAVSSAKAIRAVEEISRADLRTATPVERFDIDPWIVNTPDGLVNLHTGELMPHDRERLCRRMAGASPSALVECKVWLRFISEVTGGDKDYANYLQRLVGYILCGVRREQIFAFVFGPSNTGKSIFVATLRLLLGDYGFTASMQSFVAIRGDRNDYDLASFVGRRLITASETEEGRRWDLPRLNDLTGSEWIHARNPYGRPFDYPPTFFVLMCGNHRPRLGTSDDAMQRRMHLLPFRHKPKQIDLHLIDKLKLELPAIMAWAVMGVLMWERQGLKENIPAIIAQETKQYFEIEDAVGLWLQERCEVDATMGALSEWWTSSRDLYRDFRAFMQEGKTYVPPEPTFVSRLSTVTGLRHGRSAVGRRGFFGVRLKQGREQLNL